MTRIQKDLFDGFLRLKQCRRCRRNLHPDPSHLYRTRDSGLCFRCLDAFERSDHWSIDSFLFSNSNRGKR